MQPVFRAQLYTCDACLAPLLQGHDYESWSVSPCSTPLELSCIRDWRLCSESCSKSYSSSAASKPSCTRATRLTGASFTRSCLRTQSEGVQPAFRTHLYACNAHGGRLTGASSSESCMRTPRFTLTACVLSVTCFSCYTVTSCLQTWWFCLGMRQSLGTIFATPCKLHVPLYGQFWKKFFIWSEWVHAGTSLWGALTMNTSQNKKQTNNNKQKQRSSCTVYYML